MVMGSLSAVASALGALGMPDYPVPAFHFKVGFALTMGMTDTSFQDVSGIGSEVTTEEVVEGGENRYGDQKEERKQRPSEAFV